MIVASHSPVIQYVGVFRSLNFGSVLVEFSPPSLDLEGKLLVTPLSHEVVPWYRTHTLEYFPTPGFITPPPVRVTDFAERESSFPSSPVAFSPNPLLFPFPREGSVLVSPA